MLVKVAFGALREGRWYEYVLRFVLGGAATVVTGLIAKSAGPEIGGLFLAFPAMLCASATLIDTHERRRKREAGLSGTQRGRDAAALDGSGAAFGSLALMAFAMIIYSITMWAPWTALCLASLTWCITAVFCWSLYKWI